MADKLKKAGKELSAAEKAEERAKLAVSMRAQIAAARSKADDAAERKKWRECSTALDNVLDANIGDKDPSLFTYRSHALLKQNRFADALADAERAIALEPKSARGHYRAGRALQHERRWNEAGERLVETLALSPREPRAPERFEEVLHVMRRSRPFWPGPSKRPERVLGGSPPPTTKPPGPCVLKLESATDCKLVVSWSPPEDDGGDEIWKYSIQIAELDPLMNKEDQDELHELTFRSAFEGNPSGEGPWTTDVIDLLADTDYVLTVQAINGSGRGPLGDALHATTAKPGQGERELDTRIPKPWLELKGNMQDLFGNLQKKHEVDQEVEWEALLEAWRANLGNIKLAYRLYVLFESIEQTPTSMNMNQFRQFCIDIKCGASKPDIDIIFTRANRSISDGEAKKPAKKDAGADKGKMGQDEFLHGIIRLGYERAERQGGKGSCASLAKSFREIMNDCVTPYAVFDLEDELTAVLQTRGVRAALGKHKEQLHAQYMRWSGADAGAGADASTM